MVADLCRDIPAPKARSMSAQTASNSYQGAEPLPSLRNECAYRPKSAPVPAKMRPMLVQNRPFAMNSVRRWHELGR